MTKTLGPPPAMDTEEVVQAWGRALHAENISRHTIKSYMTALRQLSTFAAARGLAPVPAMFSRELVRDFIAHVNATRSPATAQTRFDGLKACYRWLVDEGEMDVGASPMLRVKRPRAPEPETEILSLEQVRQLVEACDRRTWRGARDRAIILLLIDMGPRVGGLVGVQLDDLDMREQLVKITLKGGRRLTLPFGVRAAQALERYLRLRRLHACAELPDLWLGQRGRRPCTGQERDAPDARAAAGRRASCAAVHRSAHWQYSCGTTRALAGNRPQALRR